MNFGHDSVPTRCKCLHLPLSDWVSWRNAKSRIRETSIAACNDWAIRGAIFRQQTWRFLSSARSWQTSLKSQRRETVSSEKRKKKGKKERKKEWEREEVKREANVPSTSLSEVSRGVSLAILFSREMNYRASRANSTSVRFSPRTRVPLLLIDRPSRQHKSSAFPRNILSPRFSTVFEPRADTVITDTRIS